MLQRLRAELPNVRESELQEATVSDPQKIIETIKQPGGKTFRGLHDTTLYIYMHVYGFMSNMLYNR